MRLLRQLHQGDVPVIEDESPRELSIRYARSPILREFGMG